VGRFFTHGGIGGRSGAPRVTGGGGAVFCFGFFFSRLLRSWPLAIRILQERSGSLACALAQRAPQAVEQLLVFLVQVLALREEHVGFLDEFAR
jgi:hypothetical protein